MKIIILNCWYGQAGNALSDFIEEQKKETDIFCFTENDPDLYQKLRKQLTNFDNKHLSNPEKQLIGYYYGQTVFVKNNLKITDHRRIDTYVNTTNDMGFMQYLALKAGQKTLHIANVHGITYPGNKTDTPKRLSQSNAIIDFLKNKKGPKIIGGDFNLMPQTKSIALFEKEGYVDLVKEFNIKETRGPINHKKFQKEGNIQHYADYAFVSKDVKVKDFQVPMVSISDHLPLILDFEL